MTLTIELTPEEEARIRQEAAACGLDTQEYAHRKLVGDATNGAPRKPSAKGKYAGRIGSSDEFAARKQLSARGKYADKLPSSDAYAAEKQREIALEEKQARKRHKETQQAHAK